MAQIKVSDISRWQGTINWDVFRTQIDAVVIKATGADGGLYTDGKFKRNQAEARRVGLPIWYYHFKGAGSARQQAEYFLAAIGELREGEGLVLDDENEARINVGFACEFADRIKELTGINIILYSNQSRFGAVDLQPIKDRNIGAWSAKYGTNSGVPEGNPATAGILPVIMWQYTSTARVAGVTENSVDMNIFYGDVAAFKKYGVQGNVPAPTPVPTPPSTGDGTYRVVKGDTLSGIGARLGLNWQDIARWNGIVAPYTIYPNQVLKVYGGSAGSNKPSPVGSYTVVKGDTLSGIGSKTNTKWQEIASLNGINPPYTIYPGQVLKMPSGGGSAPAPVRTYTVVPNDTLSGIGAKTGTKWQDIAALNGIKPPYTIYPNQVLRLP